MDLRALSKLKSLQLFNNPLEFLPELSPCTALRHLSLANVRISADVGFAHWEVSRPHVPCDACGACGCLKTLLLCKN